MWCGSMGRRNLPSGSVLVSAAAVALTAFTVYTSAYSGISEKIEAHGNEERRRVDSQIASSQQVVLTAISELRKDVRVTNQMIHDIRREIRSE